MAQRTGVKALQPQKYQGTKITVGLKPGDPLPQGTYVNGWKLDPSYYGKNMLYIIYQPDEEAA